MKEAVKSQSRVLCVTHSETDKLYLMENRLTNRQETYYNNYNTDATPLTTATYITVDSLKLAALGLPKVSVLSGWLY